MDLKLITEWRADRFHFQWNQWRWLQSCGLMMPGGHTELQLLCSFNDDEHVIDTWISGQLPHWCGEMSAAFSSCCLLLTFPGKPNGSFSLFFHVKMEFIWIPLFNLLLSEVSWCLQLLASTDYSFCMQFSHNIKTACLILHWSFSLCLNNCDLSGQRTSEGLLSNLESIIYINIYR